MVFLIDDLLTAPARGLFWVFREVHNAALEAQKTEQADITRELSDLYLQLERGEIDEATFDAREEELLALLDDDDEDEDEDDEDNNEPREI